MNAPASKRPWWFPWLVALAAALALWLWLARPSDATLTLRLPGADRAPEIERNRNANPVLAGQLLRGDGVAVALPGAWPGFRGPDRNGISRENHALARSWEAAGPRVLWSIDVGEGYAGAAVRDGRVYLIDYDREHKQDAVRCLSLADGREIWRFAYPVAVKRNHGMSRTVPALTEKLVVTIGPKCHVACLDAVSGELRWGLDLVRQFGATVPPWYTGQCPLIDGDRVILAPGGPEALLIAVEAATGKRVWQSPNPAGWTMTHSSVMPMEFAGRRFYVYCASGGVAGVSAEDGALLWETSAWKISIATVPSPVVLDEGRLFLAGGYNAGSLLLQLQLEGSRWVAREVFRLGPEVFGATQHTPIYFEGHLYGVRPDGQFVCLDLDGKVQWTSGVGYTFGLGSFLLADGLLFAMNDTGRLHLIEATAERFAPLAQAQVLHGRESWAPLALAGGRLLARDLTQLVCLDVGAR